MFEERSSSALLLVPRPLGCIGDPDTGQKDEGRPRDRPLGLFGPNYAETMEHRPTKVQSRRMDDPPLSVPVWVERMVARWTAFSGWNWLLVAALLVILAVESAFNQWRYPLADILVTLVIVGLVGVRRK